MSGGELRAWRLERGLTQQVMAERLGVDAQTVSRWERDERPMPPFLGLALVGLAQVLSTERKPDAHAPVEVPQPSASPADSDDSRFEREIEQVFQDIQARQPAAHTPVVDKAPVVTPKAPSEPQHRPAAFHSVRGGRCSCGLVLSST